MVSKVFASEIDLNQVKTKHKALFNEIQVRAYLGSLGTCYQEALVITISNYVAFIVIGHSPALIGSALKDLVGISSELEIATSREAISLLISIATGTRWNKVSLQELRTGILRATELSIESDCFGSNLRTLVDASLVANMRSTKKKEINYANAAIATPSVETLDFSKISSN